MHRPTELPQRGAKDICPPGARSEVKRLLYRTEFHTFEAYCRIKWASGGNYVGRLMSAAQVFTHLMTAGHQKPEHEKQVRPLAGLTPAQAQLAWDRAGEIVDGRKTSRVPRWALFLRSTYCCSRPSRGPTRIKMLTPSEA
jgi:hypothetical protein